MRSRSAKIILLWSLFILASAGTYILSNRIESGATRAAAALDSQSQTASAFSAGDTLADGLGRGASYEVDLSTGKADPSTVDARPGDEVLFIVKDDSRHDIAEERSQRKEARLESGEIGKDESYSLVFRTPGRFSFYDRLNQSITVTVTIR